MKEEGKASKNGSNMTKEELRQMLEEKEDWIFQEPYEGKAFEKFVRKPKEENLYDKIKRKSDFILLFILFGVIFFTSIISVLEGAMESYAAIPIAVLSLLGILILIKCAKKHDKKNNKKYK